eukprot:CAMPEP_0172326350 /NCGR_PEP_ID=MMETSP1058-20130122/56254_1 /TAXON_ID=83371 /ORGANISM="Detonula confervacea, Strain CCMP 353" /LENGTH=546 /DNA_ID=CAMNT_0013043107 /DNA_START=225 /DNA_END=1862 /DNA_ORIENTATION=-
MGAKKKGKKKSSSNASRKGTKSDDGVTATAVRDDSGDGLSGGLEAPSLSSTPKQLNDVSSLLFDNNKGNLPFALPFIGPISLAERGASVDEEGSNAVSHGRGLIATRDVSLGECLFVIPSIVSADAVEVRRRYLQEGEGGGGDEADLEQITEDHLVETVQSLCEILEDEEIQPKENVDRARRLLGAFTAQMSSEELPIRENSHDEWMDILLANESSSPTDNKDSAKLDKETILNIIRRNAFGPDYHNYANIEECWTTKVNTETCYNRLLGVYPLSAMINHSCSPNAVRVFGRIPSPNSKTEPSEIDNFQGREVMIVHANAHIPKGTEITWAYLPPSTPFAARREMLRSRFRFTCQCTRCIKEEAALNMAEYKELWALADGYWSLRDVNINDEGASTSIRLVPSIEKIFSSTKQIPNESQRYLRVGYSGLYMEFINLGLSLENDESISQTLQMATQLHFSFVSCNNASTEHLSILHLCYDLSTLLRTRAMKGSSPDDTARTMAQVRFWTEQIKKAHMVRYGDLGEDVENVREAMKHSKLVLRNIEGW